jgi:hypothetical protein
MKEDANEGACDTCGDNRKVYRGLVGTDKGRRPLGRTNHRWVDDNVKVDLKEIGWKGVEWTEPS